MASLTRNILDAILGSPVALHPTENLFAAGVLGALNAEIIADADGKGVVMLDLRGTFSMTVEVSGSVDGTNWTILPVRPVGQSAKQYVAAVAGTAAGVWQAACGGYRKVRARVTAYTSGGAVATMSLSNAILDQSLDGMITPLAVTTIGAGGVATTLTIPAPGAGLRQYLTYLSINRFCSTGPLTASGTPIAITTTNLPGSLAFTFAADALTVGQIDRWREDFAYPIASSALNTATTIVCPATTGVMWRVTAGYYVAP